MSDLAKDLRRFSFHDKISTMPWETLKLIDAAADRIEELEAALRGVIARADRDCPEFREAHAALKGKVDD